MIKEVGNSKVILIAGGGKIYTDLAARFVKSEKNLEDIVASPYNKSIIANILESKHYAALEFDYFIFGVEGCSRVCETQLIRKRLASYMIKSGRQELNGKRSFNLVLPRDIEEVSIYYKGLDLNTHDIVDILEKWYNKGLEQGLSEENLRYMKPQGTEFKGIIGMNAHALRDWFQIRCCNNAQFEIRDLAKKMLKLCKEVAPDLFENAGASCKSLGYCPENRLQHKLCQGVIPTHNEVLELIKSKKLEKTYK